MLEMERILNFSDKEGLTKAKEEALREFMKEKIMKEN